MQMSSEPARTHVTLSVTLDEDQLPGPGESVEVTLSNGMVAIVENRAGITAGRHLRAVTPGPARPVPRTLSYVPVEIASRASEVVHAAITRRVNNRNQTERYTICDRTGKRIVSRPIYAPLDTTVTCKQCRTQLAEDGVIPAGN